MARALGFRLLISDIATYFHLDYTIFFISHVNNCLFIGLQHSQLQALKKVMGNHYDIEDLGPARYFLGV